jgi:hypothetical protein
MTNTYTDTEAYLNQCVDLVFPFQLYLRENKRLTTPEDKEKLRLFKRDIFDPTIPPPRTVAKYFKLTDQPDTDFNIAYFNATCKTVAERTRERMGKTDEYEVGETLVCRQILQEQANGREEQRRCSTRTTNTRSRR